MGLINIPFNVKSGITHRAPDALKYYGRKLFHIHTTSVTVGSLTLSTTLKQGVLKQMR